MSKTPKELYESGEITKKKGDDRSCAECGELVEEYLWSPLFCPKCDVERMERIHNAIKEIGESF